MNRTRRPAASSNGSPSVESVVATVRTLWTAVEGANDGEKANLKRDITQTVNRLKSRIESRLRRPVPEAAEQPFLFEHLDEQHTPETENFAPSFLPRFAEPVLREYASDFASHALQHLPQAVKYHSVEDFRDYLPEKLRFNSQATRYEKGGLNSANLSDEQQIETEDDYRICARRGSTEETKPKRKQRKMKPDVEHEDE
jgi:hypothetical protein